MNIHQILFFCFLSAAVHDGGATLPVYQRLEGRNLTVVCPFSSSESRKFFCRRTCEEGNILIDTHENRSQSGRYSIEYEDIPETGQLLSVTITQVNKSDSDRFRCGLGNPLFPAAYREFGIAVIDALQTGSLSEDVFFYREVEGNDFVGTHFFNSSGTVKFLCKNGCEADDLLIHTTGDRAQSGRYSLQYTYIEGWTGGVLDVAISQVTRYDSGRYTCGVDGEVSEFELIVDEATTQSLNSSTGNSTPSSLFPESTVQCTEATRQSLNSSTGNSTPSSSFPESTVQCTEYLLPLVVCVFVVVVVVLVAVVLLLLYERKTNRNSDDMNMERVAYKNRPPVSTCEDSIYQSLDSTTRDQDQIYSTQHT